MTNTTTIKLKDAVSQAVDRYRQANNDFANALRIFMDTHTAADRARMMQCRKKIDEATTNLNKVRSGVNVHVAGKQRRTS